MSILPITLPSKLPLQDLGVKSSNYWSGNLRPCWGTWPFSFSWGGIFSHGARNHLLFWINFKQVLCFGDQLSMFLWKRLKLFYSGWKRNFKLLLEKCTIVRCARKKNLAYDLLESYFIFICLSIFSQDQIEHFVGMLLTCMYLATWILWTKPLISTPLDMKGSSEII